MTFMQSLSVGLRCPYVLVILQSSCNCDSKPLSLVGWFIFKDDPFPLSPLRKEQALLKLWTWYSGALLWSSVRMAVWTLPSCLQPVVPLRVSKHWKGCT